MLKVVQISITNLQIRCRRAAAIEAMNIKLAGSFAASQRLNEEKHIAASSSLTIQAMAAIQIVLLNVPWKYRSAEQGTELSSMCLKF